MRGLALVTLAAAFLAFVLGGAAPFARILLAVGLPGAAAALFDDPAWRGVALYRAGDMQAAQAEFSAARAHFNLGNAAAHLGAYAAALEAYDIALVEGVADARANFDLVAAFYSGTQIDPEALGLIPQRQTGPKMESSIAQGDARAAGTGDAVTNSNTMMGLAQLDSHGRLGVRRIFDDKFMVADDRWLGQLSDVPGEYLAARIAHEAKARARAGLTPPTPDDPR